MKFHFMEMNMFLLFVTIIIIHFKNSFFFYDMTTAVVCEKEDFLIAYKCSFGGILIRGDQL